MSGISALTHAFSISIFLHCWLMLIQTDPMLKMTSPHVYMRCKDVTQGKIDWTPDDKSGFGRTKATLNGILLALFDPAGAC
jgi:hypothetical protein